MDEKIRYCLDCKFETSNLQDIINGCIKCGLRSGFGYKSFGPRPKKCKVCNKNEECFKDAECMPCRAKKIEEDEELSEDNQSSVEVCQSCQESNFCEDFENGECLPRQRVEEAFEVLILEGETENQKEWLDDIKIHLETNIIVEPEDFRSLPFSRKGGFTKANQDFDGKLNETLEKINERILQPM